MGKSRDVLERIVQHNRRRISETAWKRDWPVEAALGAQPWSIERLGPPLTEGVVLARIAAAVIRDGQRLTLTEAGHEVTWISARDELIDTYLASLVGADGTTWQVVIDALEEMWREASPAEEAVDEDDEETAIRNDHASVLRYLSITAEQALEDRWREAFAEGRILVFEKRGDYWVFQAPHVWKNGPPFRCREISEIKADFDRRREEELIAFRNTKFGRALMPPDIFGFQASQRLLAAWPDGAGFAAVAHRPFAFLLSRDVEALVSEIATPKQRSGGPDTLDKREIRKQLVSWFQAEIRNGRAWYRKKKEALAELESKAAELSGKPHGWGNMAKSVWDEVAPSDWKQGGAPKKTK